MIVLLLALSCSKDEYSAIDFDPETLKVELTKLETVGKLRFDTPVFVTHLPDDSGRTFVLEKMGNVQLVPQQGELSSRPFLNIVNSVNNGDLEEGLLGLAFEPDFSLNPRIYAYYVRRPGRGSRGREREAVLVRYTLTDPSATVVDPATEEILLRVHQPDTNHNGGMLTFGPDGMLYLGLGDGGGLGDNFGNAQNPKTLLGSILRLDVSGGEGYQIPTDNPWAGRDDVRPEIWAMGLRNPWRFHFHPQTKDVYVGDVGESNIEEINVRRWDAEGVPNFGWPVMEGNQCYPEPDGCKATGFVEPIHGYPHKEGNCAVVSGPVYRGDKIPGLKGVVLFGDFCSGKIWGAWKNTEGWQTVLLHQSNARITSFGEDAQGEVLVSDLNGFVYRLANLSD